MATIPSTTDRILQEIAESPGCLLEEVVLACPELSWSQVFHAVDSLSRSGLVQLKRESPGVYTLRIPEHRSWDGAGGRDG